VSSFDRGRIHLFLARLHSCCGAAWRFAAAVFAALVVPDIAFAGGVLGLGIDNPKLVAALVAGPVAWRTRNTLATIVTGMVTLHLAERFLV
jgi:branched-subunit amino acid transport protein